MTNLLKTTLLIEDIKKIIGEIPPVVLPKSETLQNILEFSYNDFNYPVPFDAALVSKLINVNRLDKDGNFFISDIKLPEDEEYTSIEDAFKLIRSEATRKKAWDYFQKNRNNQEFLAALSDFAHTYKSVRISNDFTHSKLHIRDGSNVPYRNCAMTAVAKALDLVCLADSYKLNISDNGKVTEGTFMEKAQGTDLLNMSDWKKRDEILKNGFNDKRFLKSISDLQVIDYICGNIDRHVGNLFFKIDEKTNTVCGVIGIDNDASFGETIKNAHLSQHLLMPVGMMKAIDEKTAEKVNKLTENQLRGILAPFNLNEEEIKGSILRLNQIKTAIKSKQKFGAIKTLKDEDWAKTTLNDLSYEGKGKETANTFTVIKNAAVELINGKVYECKSDIHLEEETKLIGTSLNVLGGELENYEKQLNSAKSIWNNSDKYKDLIKTVSSLKKVFNVNMQNLSNPDNDRKKINDDLKKYKENLTLIREKANDYLTHKKKDIDNNFNLECYDSIHISSYSSLKPVMFVEGAINASEGTKLEAADRVAVQFDNNTNYAYLIREHAGWFKSATCDGQNAYIIRRGEIIPINIDQILYDKAYYSELTVEPYDTLRVPFKQYFVSVAGAVSPTPALLTKISILPITASASATIALTFSTSVTSHLTAWHLTPIASISAFTASNFSSLLAATTTSAP